MTDSNGRETREQNIGGGIDKEAGNKWQGSRLALQVLGHIEGRVSQTHGKGKNFLRKRLSKLRLETCMGFI